MSLAKRLASWMLVRECSEGHLGREDGLFNTGLPCFLIGFPHLGPRSCVSH